MSNCDVTREALNETSIHTCPICRTLTIAHQTEAFKIKKEEIHFQAEIKKEEIHVQAEIKKEEIHVQAEKEVKMEELRLKVNAGNESFFEKLSTDVHALALRQHVMNEQLPKITQVFITPSEYKKSIHKEIFLDVLHVFGFGRRNMSDRVVDYMEPRPANSDTFEYNFLWEEGQPESDSYEKLMTHLCDKKLDIVCVANGQGLPDGLLYYEEIWSLKKNTTLSSEDMRKTGNAPVFKYTLRGRTDLVRIKYRDEPLGKSNNQYFIEIKRAADFALEDSLREAFLQLVGGNASNSFHSPPVLLTNLAMTHYVLFVTLVGDPTICLKYELHVLKMPTFGVAVAFLEERTAEMNSVTLHFGRRPTPPSSPQKNDLVSDSSLDVDDIADRFNNVDVEEAVAK